MERPMTEFHPTVPCQSDPNLFFSENESKVRKAKDMCIGCPIRVKCLTTALNAAEQHGVWGATEPEERRLALALDSGWKAQKYAKEIACANCAAGPEHMTGFKKDNPDGGRWGFTSHVTCNSCDLTWNVAPGVLRLIEKVHAAPKPQKVIEHGEDAYQKGECKCEVCKSAYQAALEAFAVKWAAREMEKK
jgi:hypothetical protein